MNWSYLFKHWFATLLLAPIVAQIIVLFAGGGSHSLFGFFETYFLFVFFGLFFSTPTYFLYAYLFSFLKKKNTCLPLAKMILIAFAVSGIIITFWSIGGSWSHNEMLSYGASSIISGLYFKLNRKQS